MFVQVIHGKVADAAGFQRQTDKWQRELSAGAPGYLGSTQGVTKDGEVVAFVRFDTEEHARQNSNRPEQDAWWNETAKYMQGDAEFKETTDVMIDTIGNPDDAKFVQVIEGRTTNIARSKEILADFAGKWASERPDILARVATGFADGTYAAELFFTSEAEAREGESKPRPAEMQAAMDEMRSLEPEPPRFFDLENPIIHTP